MIYAWSVLAATTAVGAEIVLSRATSYMSIMWLVVPAALAVNYSVWQLLRLGPSFISSLIVFSIATATIRVIYSVGMRQEVGIGTWVAIIMVLGAGVLRHLWP